MRPRLPSAGWLLGSLLLHSTLALSAVLPAASGARARSSASEADPDPWVGDAFEVDALTERPGGAPPAPAATADPRAAVAHEPPSPAKASPSPPKVSARAPREEQTSDAREPARDVPRPATPPGSAAPQGAEAHLPAAGATPERTGEDPGGASSFGALRGDAGVRNLPKAFVRALPAAASERDSAWLKLPAGPAGRARVTLSLDEQGHVAEVEFEREEQVPGHLKRLVRRGVRLLGAGTFALSAAASERGREAFSLVVSITDGPPLGDEFAAPDHRLLREFEAPTAGRAGKAVFGYASGRRVEVRVELVPPSPG